ncbi:MULTISPECIES: adenosylcobinamide-GDP ribazoletransferase [Alicyclobacillus]|uniref:adenosylcobinamide-GDP ribazoletransferase n=1 Tax=Alicyclobacillus TaxID=29330 RepID=UPI000836F9AC|nr:MULTISPECIES: adenosylcobinamide-GDP ribazoletransferase [Alicyclobacillus]MCL6626930.1 adenosylcobinamide-GDP ribazoletransferase [Alicyclobacillus shizuokensis]
MAVIRWLTLAVQFATVCPTPRVRVVRGSDLHASMGLVPVVGLGLGGFLWIVYLGLAAVLPVRTSAAVALALYTASTGALHLDGWMDTVDALACRRSRDEALAVMKDSRSGAVGVVFCVLMILVKYTALVSVPAAWPAGDKPWLIPDAWLWWAPMLSRLGMVWSMRMAPAARPGQGLGAIYAGRLPLPVILLATFLTGLCGLALLPAWHVLAAGALTLGACVGFTAWMRRRFGGMTGDTYGALHEALETLLWLMAAALLAREG